MPPMKPMTMAEGFERSGSAAGRFAGASMCWACDPTGRNAQNRAVRTARTARTAVRIRELQRRGEFPAKFVRLAIPRSTSLNPKCIYAGRNSMMFFRFRNGYFRFILMGPAYRVLVLGG